MENNYYAIASPLCSWENHHAENISKHKSDIYPYNNTDNNSSCYEKNLKISNNYNSNLHSEINYSNNFIYEEQDNLKANFNGCPLISSASQGFLNSNNFYASDNNTIFNQTKNLFGKSNMLKSDSLEDYCYKYQNYFKDENYFKNVNEHSNNQTKNLSRNENTIDIIFQNRVTDPFLNETNPAAAYSNSIKENSQKIKIDQQIFSEDEEDNYNNYKYLHKPKYNFYYNKLDNFSVINEHYPSYNKLVCNSSNGKNKNRNGYYKKANNIGLWMIKII